MLLFRSIRPCCRVRSLNSSLIFRQLGLRQSQMRIVSPLQGTSQFHLSGRYRQRKYGKADFVSKTDKKPDNNEKREEKHHIIEKTQGEAGNPKEGEGGSGSIERNEERSIEDSSKSISQTPDTDDLPNNDNEMHFNEEKAARDNITRRLRITKEQLLSEANSLYSRLKIRLKWFLKRSNRPFSTDDYSALFSWIVMGNVLLFFVGTTTFFSLIILTFNTVFAQEFVARKVGEFLTQNSKLTVTFEHAIVPGWSDGKISFKKCFVSRRPKSSKQFVKGSQAEAYAASLNKPLPEIEAEEEIDDGNYTQFDLTLEEINVSLSFNKWVNGTGIIDTIEIKGLRGVVDRTHVHWDPDDDATNYKNIYQPGDFEFNSFKMEDVLFKLMQPDNFRHFDVAIYKCELSRLRKHWLIYDFLNANMMSGSYDNSLFTIHKKQRLTDFDDSDISQDWRRVTRLRVDSLNLDHLNTGLEGPFGWITSGKVDMVGDVMVPEENNVLNVSEIVNLIAASIAKEANRYKNPEVKKQKYPDHHVRLTENKDTDISKYFVLDLTIRLNNVRASVPFKAPQLSYINYALIRPIVAYINSKNTFIEIKSRIVKNIADFSGSWTVYDSLLMDDISEEVYDSFVDYVADEESRLMRMRKVGFWSLQLLFQFIVFGLGALT